MERLPVYSIRRARPDEAPAIASTFARAFADDPLMRWFVGDTHRYPGFFAQSLRHLAFPADGAWTTEGGEAVAIWLAPEQAKPSIARQLAMLPSLLRTCRGRTARVLRTLAITGRHHPPEPAWYLLGLGAANPGKGHGSALLAALLVQADEDGRPSYLESSNPRNLAFYERFGFVAATPIELPNGPSIMPMLRAPR